MSTVNLDRIPNLNAQQMRSASPLIFAPYGGPETFDSGTGRQGFGDTALYRNYYKFHAHEGATYDILSLSYHDPYSLTVYDQYGKPIATNDEADDPSGFLRIDGVFYGADRIGGLVAAYTGTFYIVTDWHADASNLFYHVSVTEARGQKIEGSDWADALMGTAYADAINGHGGKDVIDAAGGNDSIAGGGGIDVAILPGVFADYKLVREGTTATLSGKGATVTLTDVERVWFSDLKLAIDVDGNGGQAYRLYQAAFDRIPDAGGLGFQMKTLDDGWSLSAVAANFIASPEFQGKYGSLDNTQFVTQLYLNVLHRTPDSEGLSYHLDRLSNGVQRESILVGFSESPENQANVIGAIEHGMLYLG
jgi:hypothetical protein